ncbi:hypothetical protein HAX54_031130 [Datura stramonium]|uniref:Uncharacterized protein n=1 Tax=Datura stramonium TaxID=4076 RepID=A0ABS8V9F4_DATST|nr:hypothetical protein [Datura stramonium]
MNDLAQSQTNRHSEQTVISSNRSWYRPFYQLHVGLGSMERTYRRTVGVVVSINGPSYGPIGSTGKMTSPGNKKQHEGAARKEIAETRSSVMRRCRGYNLTSQYDEGSEEAKSDGDNPSADNAEKGNGNEEEGNDDAEESRYGDNEAEESSDK